MSNSKQETALTNYLANQIKRKNFTSYKDDDGIACKRIPILESEVEACRAVLDSKKNTGEYIQVGKDFASYATTSLSGKTSYVNMRPRNETKATDSVFGDISTEEPNM